MGVGASAGGLEAFSEFLRAVPPDLGMAIVLVQHLAPNQSSLLADLLAGSTTLPVVQVVDGMALAPDKVYVIPPGVYMMISAGKLQLIPRPDDGSQFMPIDFFLRSLAEYAQGNAVGVILSGTASDGTIGLREIKAVGGITMAQLPKTAKYDGMPRSAISMGVVDVVTTPAEMARELTHIAEHPLVRHVQPRREGEELQVLEDSFHRILTILRSVSGVDFTHYKQPTLKRRIQRRMVLHKIRSTGQYIKLLQKDRQEAEKLFQDILINVTRFFREPDSYRVLAKEVFPLLLKDWGVENPVRVWIPGCSTGEEPYSVSISLLEHLGERGQSIQVFGTDISDRAIERARAGWYPESISADVSPERLRRFFTKADGGFRINKSVRDICIFAHQDLTRDPPFSKLDLILCRNVLIYLDAVIQKKLLTVFHYALKPSGFLMLGSSETTGPNADLFSLHHKRHRLYTKKTVPMRAAMDFAYPNHDKARQAGPPAHSGEPTELEVQDEASRVIAARYSPPGVIVDSELQIVQFRGLTGAFLQPAPGNPNLNVLKMVRQGLLYPLRSALHESRKSDKPVRRERIKVKTNGQSRMVDMEVVPLPARGGRRNYLVLFLHASGPGSPAPAIPSSPAEGKEKGEARNSRLKALREELAASREYLQSIIQDLEAANEELQSANEENLSSNEELQSTNEELNTAREELQSTNEEINTVNDELHVRNEELSRANSDLLNLLGTVQVAIVILDRDLRIRRFTPVSQKVLSLIPSDIGRPIGDLKLAFDCPDLEGMIGEVMNSVSTVEQEVRDRAGNPLLLRIRPYKNLENRIDGAVLSFFDIHQSRTQMGEVIEAKDFANAIVDTVRQPLVILDSSLRVKRANRAFSNEFQVPGAEVAGQYLYNLANGPWNSPSLRRLLEEVLPQHKSFQEFEFSHELPGGRRRYLINGRQLDQGDDREPLILLAMEEIAGDAGN